MKLKSCPFCGSEAKSREYMDDYNNHGVYCTNDDCGCILAHGSFETVEEAEIAWNRRDPLESPEALSLEQLRSWTMGEPLFIRMLPPCHAECWEVPFKMVNGAERLICKGDKAYFIEYYGKTWTAFARKPKKEATQCNPS